MTRTAKQSVGLFLLVAVLGFLAWRLWPDGGEARQRQSDSDLRRAVQVSNFPAVMRLLDEGADPNGPHRAQSLSEKAQVYYFGASRGISKMQYQSRLDDLSLRRSALQIAAIRGDADMVSVLLSKGGATDYRDGQGDTALVWALREQSMTQRTAHSDRDYPRIVALLKAAASRRRPAPRH